MGISQCSHGFYVNINDIASHGFCINKVDNGFLPLQCHGVPLLPRVLCQHLVTTNDNAIDLFTKIGMEIDPDKLELIHFMWKKKP